MDAAAQTSWDPGTVEQERGILCHSAELGPEVADPVILCLLSEPWFKKDVDGLVKL